ncbi:MAG: HAD family hydrolase [Sphingomonadaceae bacterium]
MSGGEDSARGSPGAARFEEGLARCSPGAARFEALILDFDGVLIDSEYEGNAALARYLAGIGHAISPEQSMRTFMGLAGDDFHAAVETHIGRPLPADFAERMSEAYREMLGDGVAAVAGAIDFVRKLPPALPRAIASSSSTRWISGHLERLGLAGHFGDMIFSGREHVARGKPAPDLYLHAARALGADIAATAIVEDSPVGMRGAVASGATVIGLCAGSHCDADHGARLKALGAHHVAQGFGEVAALLGIGR